MKKLLSCFLVFFLPISIFAEAPYVESTNIIQVPSLEEVLVSNFSGDLIISSTSTTSAGTLLERIYDKEDFFKNCKIIKNITSSKILIQVKRITKRYSVQCRVDFELSIPNKKVSYEISSGSGNVTLIKAFGSAEVALGSGNTNFDQVLFEKLKFDQGSGNLNFLGTSHDLNINSGSGNITFKGILGEKTVIKSGSGDLILNSNKQSKGSLDIFTGSGNVTLNFFKNFKAKISIMNPMSNVENALGSYPDAPFAISIATESGNIVIH